MDTMAFNKNEISSMQGAIEAYITEVEAGLSSIRDMEITSEHGFYGNKQITKVNSYINNTCNEINHIVRYFDEFKEKLTQVQLAYEAEDEAVTTGEVAAAPKENPEELVTVNRMK